MENKRLFISLAIEPNLGKEILKQFQGLQLPWTKIKNVKLENLHLNLKFLGSISLEKLPEIINSLNKLKTNVISIEININETLIFNPQRLQTLVLGIKKNKNLQKLFNDIEKQLFVDGLAHKETRKFTPHITLARVKKSADLIEFKDFENWSINKNFDLDYFELIESKLGSSGPTYTKLQSFNL